MASPPASGVAPAAPRPIIAAAVQTWLRYVVPLTLLSAVALAPVIVIALRTRVPADPAGAKAVAATGWWMIGVAWSCQLVLVGGASAMTGARPSQLRALAGGLRQLVRAIVPCLAAVAAVAIGCLALAVPGLVLVVLLALTGASRERGVPAMLADSIAAARKHLPAVAVTFGAMLAIDVVIGVLAHRLYAGALPKQPAPAQLVAARHVVHAIAAALVIVSPLPATVLAMIRARAEPAEPETA
jgi:hypothetical protein